MTKPQVALVIGVLAISIFPILVKLELTPGTISAFYRMAFSAALIIPYAIITRSFKLPKTKYLLFSVLCGFIFGTDIIVWNVAIIESTATQATLLSNLSPVWVGLGTFLFLASKPKINFWIGTVIALFGMVVLIGFDFFFDLSFDRAFLLAILSGMLYANYMLVSKSALEKVDVISYMCIMLFSASVFTGIVSYLLNQPFTGFSNEGWLVLVVQAVICQLLAWLVLSYATKHMRATRISVSLLGQGFIATILAWVFLKEEITFQMLIGGVILLVGIGTTFVERPLIPVRSRKRQ